MTTFNYIYIDETILTFKSIWKSTLIKFNCFSWAIVLHVFNMFLSKSLIVFLTLNSIFVFIFEYYFSRWYKQFTSSQIFQSKVSWFRVTLNFSIYFKICFSHFSIWHVFHSLFEHFVKLLSSFENDNLSRENHSISFLSIRCVSQLSM